MLLSRLIALTAEKQDRPLRSQERGRDQSSARHSSPDLPRRLRLCTLALIHSHARWPSGRSTAWEAPSVAAAHKQRNGDRIGATQESSNNDHSNVEGSKYLAPKMRPTEELQIELELAYPSRPMLNLNPASFKLLLFETPESLRLMAVVGASVATPILPTSSNIATSHED